MEGLKNKNSQLIGIGLILVLMTASIAYVLKDESPASIFKAVTSVSPVYILIGIVLMALYIMCEGINIWITMKALKKETTIKDCLGYGFVGFYFSSVTPSASGGQPAQIFFMKRDGLSVTSSSLSLMIILFAHQVVVIFYAILAFIVRPNFSVSNATGLNLLLIFGFVSNAFILVGILILVIAPKLAFKIVNVVGLLLYKLRIAKNRERIKNKISKSLEEYEKGAMYMKKNPKVILYVTLVTIVQITILFSIPYVIYTGFGKSGISIWDIVMTQAILNIAVSSLPLPGAVGATESIFVSMFRNFFGSNLVIPGMLLTRISNFYSLFIISAIISLMMYLNTTKKNNIANIGKGES